MTVYVDDMRARFGRMIMCHMIADTYDELHAMADRIGVSRKWHQGDHYDICLAKRALAVKHGAKEVTRKELVRMLIDIAARIPPSVAFGATPSPREGGSLPATMTARFERRSEP